jgi:hypothetical protein
MRNSLRLALVMLAAGCAAGHGEKKMTATLEWKGGNGGSATHSHLIVYDDDGWQGAWRELGKDAPPLDFSKYCALIVHVGERPTGGFGVTFEAPVQKGDDLLVRYRIVKPTGFVTQAFTRSWAVKALPRPKGRLIAEYVPR